MKCGSARPSWRTVCRSATRSARPGRILDTYQEAVDISLAGGTGLIKVFVITEEPAGLPRIVGIVHNADDIEGPGSIAINLRGIGLQRYLVAHLPAVLVAQVYVDQRPGSGFAQCGQLLLGSGYFRAQREKPLIDADHLHQIFRILVITHQPTSRRDDRYARYPCDLCRIGDIHAPTESRRG